MSDFIGWHSQSGTPYTRCLSLLLLSVFNLLGCSIVWLAGSPHSKAFSTPSAAGHAHIGWWAERPKAPSAYLSEQSSSSPSTESGKYPVGGRGGMMSCGERCGGPGVIASCIESSGKCVNMSIFLIIWVGA